MKRTANIMWWCTLLLVLLFCHARSVVDGADSQQQGSNKVTLPLNEFEELFSSARLQEAERRLLDQRKMHQAEHQEMLLKLEQEELTRRRNLESQDQEARHKLFPDNFQVLCHTASGCFNASASTAGVERDVAVFDLELTLRVMQESRWTAVPLANTNSTVASDWSVAWNAGDSSSDTEFQDVDLVVSPDVMLVQRESQQVLATNRSGLFRIRFKAHARVGKSRNLNKLGMSNLLYPLSSFSLRVASTTDGASTSAVRDFSVQPAEAILEVDPSKEYTDVKATLPLTADNFDIRWLDVEESTHDETAVEGEGTGSVVDKKPKGDSPQVTAVHEVLHSIGEGIVRSSHILQFTTTSEMSSLNSVRFTVHGHDVRVTGVEGHALQQWEAEDVGNSTTLVRAVFKSSHLDSSATLNVYTERDHQVNSGGTNEVELPRIECRDVIRQVGHIAVTKDANVEVHEHSIRGLSRCEPTELSSQLLLNVQRPIVHSYKYWSPHISLVLTVKEHQAMTDTLEATIDRVHYKAVVTETHTIHSLILLMQSTKLQYLELLDLPSKASMFTLRVNSVPTKPVHGENGDGSVLVPLLLGLDPEAANQGGVLQTSVEVSYVSTHAPLDRNGTLALSPPRFTLPISVLTAHLRLPKDFEYKFTGGYGEPFDHLAYPIPSSFSYKTGKRVVEKDYEFTAIDDIWAEEEKDKTIGAVKIVTPNTGRSFYFQRLLVVDSVLTLDAKYSQPDAAPKKSWWWPF